MPWEGAIDRRALRHPCPGALGKCGDTRVVLHDMMMIIMHSFRPLINLFVFHQPAGIARVYIIVKRYKTKSCIPVFIVINANNEIISIGIVSYFLD